MLFMMSLYGPVMYVVPCFMPVIITLEKRVISGDQVVMLSSESSEWHSCFFRLLEYDLRFVTKEKLD